MRMLLLNSILLLQIIALTAASPAAAAAAAAAVPSSWIGYTPGSCKLIISAPHGGSLKPAEISPRTYGCLDSNFNCRWVKGCTPAADQCRAATVSDAYTRTIGNLLVAELTNEYNCKPYYIRSHLHRSRMDPNREIQQGAQGDPMAEAAWRQYHEQFMTDAKQRVEADFGVGLTLDLHGQTHPEGWTELGYLIGAHRLNNNNLDLDKSSIKFLGSRSNQSASALLQGPTSLGGLLQQQQQGTIEKVVPSPQFPSPGSGGYFSGGYITATHGSLQSGTIDAIQIEMPSGLRKDSNRRTRFVGHLAAAVSQFLQLHYN